MQVRRHPVVAALRVLAISAASLVVVSLVYSRALDLLVHGSWADRNSDISSALVTLMSLLFFFSPAIAGMGLWRRAERRHRRFDRVFAEVAGATSDGRAPICPRCDRAPQNTTGWCRACHDRLMDCAVAPVDSVNEFVHGIATGDVKRARSALAPRLVASGLAGPSRSTGRRRFARRLARLGRSINGGRLVVEAQLTDPDEPAVAWTRTRMLFNWRWAGGKVEVATVSRFVTGPDGIRELRTEAVPPTASAAGRAHRPLQTSAGMLAVLGVSAAVGAALAAADLSPSLSRAMIPLLTLAAFVAFLAVQVRLAVRPPGADRPPESCPRCRRRDRGASGWCAVCHAELADASLPPHMTLTGFLDDIETQDWRAAATRFAAKVTVVNARGRSNTARAQSVVWGLRAVGLFVKRGHSEVEFAAADPVEPAVHWARVRSTGYWRLLGSPLVATYVVRCEVDPSGLIDHYSTASALPLSA